MNVFFVTQVQSGRALLPEEEARHCTQVLRYKSGDAILATDGKGGWFEGTLELISKKEALIHIERSEQERGKLPCEVHIAVAPPKSIDRFEWMLEKLTELGINRVTPILSRRSERKILRIDRMEKLLLAAMKQSARAYLPEIAPAMIPFTEFLQNLGPTRPGQQRYIGHCDPGPKVQLEHNYEPGSDVVFLVGPEGDFSPEEVQMAQEAGFRALDLGLARLRTETAALAMCHTIHVLNSRASLT
jgi:16S rRNA (uracil1498-N3)-methyltransferase